MCQIYYFGLHLRWWEGFGCCLFGVGDGVSSASHKSGTLFVKRDVHVSASYAHLEESHFTRISILSLLFFLFSIKRVWLRLWLFLLYLSLATFRLRIFPKLHASFTPLRQVFLLLMYIIKHRTRYYTLLAVFLQWRQLDFQRLKVIFFRFIKMILFDFQRVKILLIQGEILFLEWLLILFIFILSYHEFGLNYGTGRFECQLWVRF